MSTAGRQHREEIRASPYLSIKTLVRDGRPMCELAVQSDRNRTYGPAVERNLKIRHMALAPSFKIPTLITDGDG